MGHKKNNSPIDKDVFFILNLVEKHGYEARVVGGAVRDFIARRKISDVDIATTALPVEIIDIFRRGGLTTSPISLEHGTVSVRRRNKFYEVTTLRSDVKTFGRRAEVKFCKSFEMDSCRRDFTINALSMDKEGKIYDYHSGIEDILSQKIRFIGDAKERIREDYLRILRYFRFTAAYGNYKCNSDYLAVISALKNNIKILSGERIISELLKIFEIPDSHRIVPPMLEILNELFSLKFDATDACVKLNIFESLSNAEKLSMLLKFSGEEDLLRRYNFPRNIREMILLKQVDHAQAFTKLKQIKKAHRIFYAKFLVVDSYLNHKYSATDAKSLLKELLEFCRSEYIDFRFSPDELKEFRLTNEEVKSLMIATKRFWLMNQTASPRQCREFARKYADVFLKKHPRSTKEWGKE
ncbi:MAG: CCA tRNA nucleotidyltransferase [Holosporaceae bacterium]|jgi:poly(A) polymerase|nr:CCA tRNA nucleotidyltransferase [Holosporaceae bacterium]